MLIIANKQIDVELNVQGLIYKVRKKWINVKIKRSLKIKKVWKSNKKFKYPTILKDGWILKITHFEEKNKEEVQIE